MRTIIGAFIPNNMPASDVYRGSGVLSQLRHIDPDIEVVFCDLKPDWGLIQSLDLVYLMKTSTPDAIRIMDMAHQCGKPVWYDCDDDLFNVPLDNQAYAYYHNLAPGCPWVSANVRKLLAEADAVTVSTENLKKEFETYSQKITVIPNALNDYMLRGIGENVPRQKIITWRGGVTHQKDLDIFHDCLGNLIKALPEWRFVFMGFSPWKLIEAAPKQVFTAHRIEYYDYMADFKALGSSIHIVPLSENKFNASKSNIAALEAIYAGSTPVVPDWPEWDMESAKRYKTVNQFFDQVFSLAMADALEKPVIRDFERLLSEVNELRVHIVKDLTL